MEPTNPFASPDDLSRAREIVTAQSADSYGCWREGSLLVVVSQGAQLPPRCTKCSEPGLTQVKQKLAWAHPALYLTILLGVLPAAILISILQKRATLDISLCDLHFENRKRNRLIVGGIMLLALALFAGGIALLIMSDHNKDLAPFGGFAMLGAIVSLLVGAIGWGIVSPIVKPKRISDRFAWLKGVDDELLGELPEFPGEFYSR